MIMPQYPGREPGPKDASNELLFEFAATEVHSKLERAMATDRAMIRDGVDNSRQYLIRSGGSDALPMPHARVGLQPAVRATATLGFIAVTVRVPLIETQSAPSVLLQTRGVRAEVGGEPISTHTLPTKDIFVEAVNGEGQAYRFMFTDEGIWAYDSGEDIVFNSAASAETTGRLFDVQPSLITAAEQQGIDEIGLTPNVVASLLHEYELFPQDNTRQLQKGTPDNAA